MNKTILVVIVVVLVLLVGGGVWYFMNSSGTPPGGSNNTTETPKTVLYFTITDAAASMGNITAIDLTIDKIDTYSAKQGWINVSTSSQTFNLLDLKAKSQAMLLVKKEVNADTYTQFKLHLAKVMVTEAGTTKEAKLPSNDFAFTGNLVVNDKNNSVGRFDFIADSSIHKAATGEFIFAPVVRFDSSSNSTVKVATDNSVVVSKGIINPSVSAGMDATGAVKLNYILDPKTNLKIDAAGIISTSGLLK